MTTDPGPFGIDAPEYSDRDRLMFVLGYEYALAEVAINYVASGGAPHADRTIHKDNVARILAYVTNFPALKADVTPLDGEWAWLRVRGPEITV